MISVTHPLESCNQEQELFLSQCPMPQRRMHELMFTMGNATYRYHKLATDHNPAENHWREWITGLEEPVKSGMIKIGFEKGKNILGFTRYVLESNDIGLQEYLEKTVPPADMEEYNDTLVPGTHPL